MATIETIFPTAISILTWKSPATLARTLESISMIAPMFAERYIICQESDPTEIALAKQHGFIPVALAKNVGIQNGIKECLSAPSAAAVLMVENDCPYIGGMEGVPRVRAALRAIQDGIVDVVQMYHTEGTSGRFKRYWKAKYPLERTLRGRLRPKEARAVSSEAASFPQFPASGTTDIIHLGNSLYKTRSDMRSWSNRPFLTTKHFFLEKLLPFAESHPTSRLVNGQPDLEHAINSRENRIWWRQQQFDIGFLSPGCFGHARIERPEGDEKALEGQLSYAAEA